MHVGTVQDGRRVPFQSWAAGGDRRRRPCGRRPAAASEGPGRRLSAQAAQAPTLVRRPKLFYSCTIASYSVAVITGPGGLAIGWATVPPKVERGWAV